MKPSKSIYCCSQCGSQSQKWLGRCPDCGEWNTFVEERTEAPGVERRAVGPVLGGQSARLHAAEHCAAHVGPVLYCAGEESEHQIEMRGERLGVGRAPLYLLAETCVERVLEEVDRLEPALLIVDSIQTVFSLKLQSAPGSVGQVRQAATDLLFTAKGRNLPTVLVGHVTKDGSLAGPKVLEHVVDTVLYFEGQQHHSHRVVRAVKNRFGAVSEDR